MSVAPARGCSTRTNVAVMAARLVVNHERTARAIERQQVDFPIEKRNRTCTVVKRDEERHFGAQVVVCAHFSRHVAPKPAVERLLQSCLLRRAQTARARKRMDVLHGRHRDLSTLRTGGNGILRQAVERRAQVGCLVVVECAFARIRPRAIVLVEHRCSPIVPKNLVIGRAKTCTHQHGRILGHLVAPHAVCLCQPREQIALVGGICNRRIAEHALASRSITHARYPRNLERRGDGEGASHFSAGRICLLHLRRLLLCLCRVRSNPRIASALFGQMHELYERGGAAAELVQRSPLDKALPRLLQATDDARKHAAGNIVRVVVVRQRVDQRHHERFLGARERHVQQAFGFFGVAQALCLRERCTVFQGTTPLPRDGQQLFFVETVAHDALVELRAVLRIDFRGRSQIVAHATQIE